MNIKLLLCLFSASLPAQTSLFAGGLDNFDSPPYTVGNIVGQSGPTSLWTSFGTWANQPTLPNSTTISGNVLPTGQLEVTQTDPAGFASALTRQYNTADLSTPYTIDFDYKLVNINSLLAGGFNGSSTNAGDYLNLYDKASFNGDFGGDGTWLIRGGQFNSTGKLIVNGATSDSNKNAYDASAPLNWYVFNYTPLVGHGFSDLASVADTGIALAPGTTYHFTVTILGGGQWNLKLSNGTTTFDSSLSGGPYGFRSAAAMPSGNLYFGYSDIGSNADATDGTTFQIDNVSVPEPSIFLLGGLGLLVVFIFRRRFAKKAVAVG